MKLGKGLEMLELVLFEIRKNYIRKHIIIFCCLLIFINILLVFQSYVAGDEDWLPKSPDTKGIVDFCENLHGQIDGELTKEKELFIISEYNRLNKMVEEGTYNKEYQPNTYTGYVMADYYIITKKFYMPMKYLVLYTSNMEDVIEKAEENISFYRKHKNVYELEKNELILNTYAGREINQFYDTKSWYTLFTYRFSDLFVFCLIILAIVPIFIQEKETNMRELILSCRRGKQNMITVKVLSVFVYIIVVNLIFSSINFLEFKFLYGLCPSEMPLYSIEAFQNTPLNCSICDFYWLTIGMKIVGCISFGMFVLLCSAVFNRVIYPYMLSVMFFAFELFISGFLASVEMWKMWAALMSPFSLVKGEQYYFELLSANIANHFFFRVDVSLVIQLIMIVASFMVLYILALKTNFRLKKRTFRKDAGNVQS
jgi:hypothetical protein